MALNTPQYRWQLKVGSASYTTITPIFSGSSNRKTSIEEDQQFHRKKFNGNFVLMKGDYDLINNAAFDTLFILKLQRQESGTWVNKLPLIKFYKTDCRFSPSEKRVDVQKTESFDNYDDFLSALDKELNLIDLEPVTTPVTYRQQAVLQVVFPGATTLANFTDGMFWESPVSAPLLGTDPTVERTNHNSMINDYGFGIYAPGGVFDYARAVITGQGLTVDVTGVYDGFSYLGDGFDQGVYRRLDDAYRVEQIAVAGGFRLELSIDGGATLFASATSASNDILIAPFHEGIVLTSLSSSETIELFIFRPYVRLLCNKTTVSGTPTVELDDTDPFPHGSFTHALPVETNTFIFDDDAGTAATRWGKVADTAEYYAGQYFNRPNSPNGSVVMPVANTVWTGASAWFYYDATLRALQEEAGDTRTVKDAYKLSDVLKVLLPAAGANLAHSDATWASDFYYASGTNTIRGTRKVPVIVPMTNILYDYDQPASKALIRLAEIMQLCAKFHNNFPYISEGIFKLEHWSYFDNGHSYTAEQVAADLTGLIDPRTSMALMCFQDAYEYAKQDLPERIEPGWMFNVSQPFTGYAIEVNSNFVQKGNIIDGKIPRFVSDLDFLHVYPQGASLEGFVFLECEEDGSGNLSVPFVEFIVSSEEEYRMNNGYASFIYAHDAYFRHGLPASSVTLNKATIVADSVIRQKIQEVVVPSIGDVDETGLITTDHGNGRIEDMEESLEHGGLKLVLRLKEE